MDPSSSSDPLSVPGVKRIEEPFHTYAQALIAAFILPGGTKQMVGLRMKQVIELRDKLIGCACDADLLEDFLLQIDQHKWSEPDTRYALMMEWLRDKTSQLEAEARAKDLEARQKALEATEKHVQVECVTVMCRILRRDLGIYYGDLGSQEPSSEDGDSDRTMTDEESGSLDTDAELMEDVRALDLEDQDEDSSDEFK